MGELVVGRERERGWSYLILDEVESAKPVIVIHFGAVSSARCQDKFSMV